jgi:hypothetical protein
MNPLPLRILALGLVAALADIKVGAGSEEETACTLGFWRGGPEPVCVCVCVFPE